MKRFKLLLTITCLFAGNAHAITWQKTYEGGEGYCVQETSSGNYIISSSKDGLSLCWVFETDTFGQTIWSHTYQGTAGLGYGTWIDEVSGGTYIVCGSPDFMKISSEGDSVWAKDYGIASYCFQEISDGNYIITGGDANHLRLIKTNTNGEIIWDQSYAEPTHTMNLGYFVRQTSDKGFIITGFTGISTEEIDTKWLWLIKPDSIGDTVWSRKYRGSNNGTFFENYGWCVRETSDTNYVIAGQCDPGGFWLLKTDKNGDTLWSQTYGGEYCKSVIIATDGNYVAVGRGSAASIWERSLPNGGDVLLVKVNPNGNTIWSRNHGGEEGDLGSCVAQTTDGGYIISGGSASFDPIGLYLLKVDSLGLLEGIAEELILEQERNWEIVSSLGPQAVLRYWNQPYGFKASVFDVSGRRVDKIKSNASAGILSWGYSYPAGVYFIRINEQLPSTVKVVLVK